MYDPADRPSSMEVMNFFMYNKQFKRKRKTLRYEEGLILVANGTTIFFEMCITFSERRLASD